IKREEAWRIMAQQVGHEFNNPLTTMKLNLQQFQRIYNDNPQSANERLMSTTTLLLEEIETLEKISSNFRDFAKMPPPSNEILQLNALVQSTFDFFKQSGEVEMSMQMSDEKLFVFADKDQLKRVLTNLIKNAVQAIPNYRNGVVKVSLYQDDFHAVIKITDNGIGIPFDKKDKIFEPHFTTKNTGTGIGLYMCKSMIELANGRIYFESEPDKFTNFYVSLPLINSTESL
ncbi:MAG: HAMP domain-containing sensor histidine kinase, partial [Saprospiraceae bacterium]